MVSIFSENVARDCFSRSFFTSVFGLCFFCIAFSWGRYDRVVAVFQVFFHVWNISDRGDLTGAEKVINIIDTTINLNVHGMRGETDSTGGDVLAAC
ncbi:hypothetical protein [Kerstersia gyiorum]|uniref:hypothetical protein n=1 Tax=Kerstersia gyiorum TaxID=206506 RepID=UPI00209D2148|nr:hypothetical protein [Kerstersia gyiorum]MCP1632900.1 hypothetical protein [Kerstersia gyiorum]MCP1635568.1 hypothetical protein [Kerstersia gyiorum]MCP1671026.1 hypothetical protein [Kerstersia gyiorum]MCP1678319.1 hypothetical protein [Kerstersia gyiorum]MCP1682119.1 hypothetical protein [Kerstersia gyiorum]